MMKVPFSLLSAKVLDKRASSFIWVGDSLKHFFPFLELNLKRANFEANVRKYISMCVLNDLYFFIFITSILTFGMFVFDIANYYLVGPVLGIILTSFVFFQQLNYPKIVANRRIKDIERNLLPALRNILVQINSGVPLFDVFASISYSNYGEISNVFNKFVKEVNAGTSQVDALEEIADRNPSLYFRRAIWQLVNGIKAGADISTVLKEVIDSLSQEQLIQIQTYGAQLNPLAMFYMLLAVIVPSLSTTFVIVISSFISLTESATKNLFIALFIFVLFVQIMFLGIIRTKRPNLLGGT
ncbi:MAG: type II secretion system F family protein [Candidatus Woesearchaeota archaeon]|nr:MAG: type II secretion system F family protein [Candidatus Woesearchaeota archaeon]